MAAGAIVAVLCGVALAALRFERTWPFASRTLDRMAGPEAAATPSAGAWTCPMHSFVRERHPGHCPICGMTLVSRSPELPTASAAMSSVDDSPLIRHLGLRIASVTRTALTRDIHTYGIVTSAGDSVFNLSPKTEGWIKRLFVSSIGQRVHKDQPLYEFYSSELIAKQREYIELLNRKDQIAESAGEISNQTAQVLASLARERLRAREKLLQADMSETALQFIDEKHRVVDVVTILAPEDGVVTQIGAREGSYVTPMIDILSFASASAVWLDVSLYPDQLAWVHDGDWTTVTYQNHAVRCRISLRSAVSDAGTRALHGRIVLPADPASLYSGEFSDVVIHTQEHQALVVPTSAIVRRGSNDFVMQLEAGQSFRMAPVKTGVANSELTEIVSGLTAADKVAVNGQFLLDADAPLPTNGEDRSSNE
jgi:Cu(I)/Ag(I) efflux system membrane fusion protein